MAQRIVLSERAIEALGAIEGDLRLRASYSRRQRNALVSQLIVDFRTQANEEALSLVSEKITPPSHRRRALLQRLEALTQGMDDEAMRNVELGFTKLTSAKRVGRPKKTAAIEPTEVIQSEMKQ